MGRQSTIFRPEEFKREGYKVMSRRCMITGKGVMSGNKVSHAQNKTRRRFLPNVQDTSVYSEILKRWVKLRVTTAGLRSIEHKGGLDVYLASTATTKLAPELRSVKTKVVKALAEKAA